MNTNSPAEVQPVPNELITLIQTADSENFKNKFDTLTLTPKHHIMLRQVVAGTKAAIIIKIENMGDANKNWLEIAKGGLVGAYGLSNALLATIAIYLCGTNGSVFDFKRDHKILSLFASPTKWIIDWPALHLLKFIDNNVYCMPNTLYYGLHKSSYITLPSLIAYKSLSYAIKKLKLGFNYKEHLQTMLANLDVIDAHIAQAKA